MEGVEDIPELVMAKGIPWNWETFPEYMEALAARPFDIDVAVQIPHSPIRVYVMGERGARHGASTPQDRAEMTQLVTEAVCAGAIGVSTSRSSGHRLKNGELAPSVTTEKAELLALAEGLRKAGAGVFQLITENTADPADELEVVTSIARAAGRPTSYTLLQVPTGPEKWRTMLDLTAKANAEGLELRGQVFPRPVGVLMGLDLSLHRFAFRPTYLALAHLPLADRVERMRDPAVKAAILAEQSIEDPQPMNNMLVDAVDHMFELTDPVNYAPRPEDALTLFAPRTVHDLPAGGRRLRQDAKGYVATIVSGEVTYRDGVASGALPGRLVRGEGWRAPAPKPTLAA